METNERDTNLNPLYTFENYIDGESMNVAMQIFIAKYVIENKTNIHTLYMFGDESVGKTHLLQAIAHQALDDNKSVEYISSVQWMNEFTANLRSQTMDKFRNKYQDCDVLLIDDIEFLSAKNQTQEELFHTINERKSKNRKTIISS